MTNAQTVFDMAMHLMDEGNESTGQTDTTDTREYKNRSLAILNALRVECFPFSDTFQIPEDGKRPACPEIPDFETPIALDDGICQGALPYGLAAHLLLGEDDAKADFFNQRYQESLARLSARLPASFGEIQSLCGGIEHGEFSRW